MLLSFSLFSSVMLQGTSLELLLPFLAASHVPFYCLQGGSESLGHSPVHPLSLYCAARYLNLACCLWLMCWVKAVALLCCTSFPIDHR